MQPGHTSRTVDTSLLLIDTPTDSRGIYTPMTRGREANHAHVAVEDNQTARDVLTRAITRDWIDQPAKPNSILTTPDDLLPLARPKTTSSTNLNSVSAGSSRNARHDHERRSAQPAVACSRRRDRRPAFHREAVVQGQIWDRLT